MNARNVRQDDNHDLGGRTFVMVGWESSASTQIADGLFLDLAGSSAAQPYLKKFKLTARLRSLLPVDLRLQCGREFHQRDTRNRPTKDVQDFAPKRPFSGLRYR